MRTHKPKRNRIQGGTTHSMRASSNPIRECFKVKPLFKKI